MRPIGEPMKTENQQVCGDGRRKNESSFTLVELMMAVIVIMILVGISVPVAKYVTDRMQLRQDELVEAEIRHALDQYRWIHGSYPIPRSARHYPREYDNDPDNMLPPGVDSPLDLVADPVEKLPFVTQSGSQGYEIDYSLVWPLMLEPMSRGEPPLITFPEVVVTRLMYMNPDGEYVTQARRSRRTLEYEEGRVPATAPIRRYMAVSPLTGRQYRYSSDGRQYQLCNRRPACDCSLCR